METQDVREVNVRAASGSYTVKIGTGILEGTREWYSQIQPHFEPTSFVVVTDLTVHRLYRKTIVLLLNQFFPIRDYEVKTIGVGCWEQDIDLKNIAEPKESATNKQWVKAIVVVIPDGESSKCGEVKLLIENICIQHQCNKSTLFIAFGGGVIGDLTGFIAATYYRGCPFIQIPTTLLAMVDSSTGGKTAVNSLPYGKNLIGSYHQPSLVIVDLNFCKTLSRRLISDGMAEIIKIGLTSLKSIFQLCERLSLEFKNNGTVSPDALKHLIYNAVKFKADVVAQDEKDSGLRNVLNFGHTIGHAIEAQLTNTWLHGECVSVGIVYELMVLRAMALCDENVIARAESCLMNYGLPTQLPVNANVGNIMRSMALDKKNQMGQIKIVTVIDIGLVDQNLMRAVSKALIVRLLSPAVSLSSKIISRGMGTVCDVQTETKKLHSSLDKTNMYDLGVCESTNDVVTNGGTSLPSSSVPSPLFIASGVVKLPGSKSIANRALLLAALGQGLCKLVNVPSCEDVGTMKNILRDSIGLNMEESQDLLAQKTLITGFGWGSNQFGNAHFCRTDNHGNLSIWVENAGTVTRFLAPIFAFLLSDEVLASGVTPLTSIIMDGNLHMRERPIENLIDCLTSAFVGIDVEYSIKQGYLPIKIYRRPGLEKVRFSGGIIEIKNKTSSQFASAMLMVAPLACASIELHLLDLEVRPNGVVQAVSQPYIDMTIEMMRVWGIEVEQKSPGIYKIPTGRYINPPIYCIEADASAASYPLAFAAISGGTVSVNMATPTDTKAALQGDSQFIHLLEKMGCTMTAHYPSDGYTTIQGPPNGELIPYQIDMNEMTDTFMTAAVLMARAAESTYYKLKAEKGVKDSKFTNERLSCHITGVANQRVKECNRIEAIVENLTRLGFKCNELDDGVQIHPSCPRNTNETPVIIDPRNDHRLAMSFAVASLTIPNIYIPEWRCVEKTFPTFWDMCDNDLGLAVEGVEFPDWVSEENNLIRPIIWLIGMRDVGKTELGRAAAEDLMWGFIDMDESMGFDLNHYVAKYGWEEFRKKELSHFKETVKNVSGPRKPKYLHSSSVQPPVIVSCGGGSVEIPEVLSFLTHQSKVVWLKRNEAEVIRALEEGDTKSSEHPSKPIYTRPAVDIYHMRKALYKQASKFEFGTPPMESYSKCSDAKNSIRRIFCSFLQNITANATTIPLFPNSKFLTLTNSTYGPNCNLKNLETITKDVDALEVRIDFLKDTTKISEEIFHIREKTKLPLILTLRSVSEGGRWNCHESSLSLCSYLEEVCRIAPEFLDVEAWMLADTADCHRIHEPSFPSRLIISRHAPSMKVPKNTCEIRLQIRQLVRFCRSNHDLIKIVYGQSDDTATDGLRLAEVARAESQLLGITIIALILGPHGRLSRCLNEVFTPVTHPALRIAAPGQMSAAAINKKREAMGLTTCNFVIMGNPVAKSLSPALHNTIFTHLGYLHAKYMRIKTSNSTSIRRIIQSSSFVGASITIPLKELVVHMAEQEPETFIADDTVAAIGAANTIVRDPTSGKFLLTNTDYLAIIRGLEHALRKNSKRQNQEHLSRVLILGAGGTARAAIFAAKRLKGDNIEIYVWNRTTTKAMKLAAEFGVKTFKTVDLAPADGFIAIIGAIPGRSIPDCLSNKSIFTSSPNPPYVLDMAYTPRITPLLKTVNVDNMQTACNYSCPIITGIELLLWQGIEQSKLFVVLGLAKSKDGETIDWDEVLSIATPEVEKAYKQTEQN